jgi:hypothetical protein
VHCIRDQPSHATHAVVDGLWGGKPKEIHRITNSSVHSLLIKFFGHDSPSSSVKRKRAANSLSVSSENNKTDVTFLVTVLWPRIVNASICHDSVSGRRWTRTLSFPARPASSSDEFLGQSFNEHNIMITDTARVKYSAHKG